MRDVGYSKSLLHKWLHFMQEHLTACEDTKFSYKDSQHHQGQPASVSRRLAIIGV
jgi:hypothetical protein